MKIMMNANLDELTEEQMRRVQSVSEENEIIVARTQEEQLAQAGDVDIVFGSFSRPLFEAATNLKWVQTEGAGIDNLMFEEFVESPVVLTSAKGTVGPHLADHTWAVAFGPAPGRGTGRAGAHLVEQDVHPSRDLGAWRKDPWNRRIGRRRS